MSNYEDVDTEAGLDTAPAEDAKLEIDPKAIEKAMLEAAEARAQDPSEMAAQAYGMYVPHFRAAIPKLSTRGLRRLVNYLVLYPLEQGDFKASSEFEKQVMQLAGQLVEAKFILIMDSYRANAEQLYAAANSELTEQETADIQAQIDNEEK